MNIYPIFTRRKSTVCHVGTLTIGGEAPIRVQTMANTSTNDIDASVEQAKRCAYAGAELLRYTTQGMREVESVAQIHAQLRSEGITLPLVADIHFRSDVADAAAAVVEKVRINPGNYANRPDEIDERFTRLLTICRTHHTALRIGVNHGSLSKRMMDQYGDTPEGMVASCMEFLRIAVREHFSDIVLSVKSSNTRVMVETVRLLVKTMDAEGMAFPLHLGVTEAGEGEDGRIKSAVGIGALLADGIGDTVRVSLSEEPEAEVPVAQALIRWFTDPLSPRYHDLTLSVDNNTVRFADNESDWSLYQLHAAAECGRLLWDNHATEIILSNPHFTDEQLTRLASDILQAARVRMYKTEFISCPGCGRTMFNLQKTVADIKRELTDTIGNSGLKIAVMGCIVNGPGEMADADYGYVGAGVDRISLYRGKQCVLKNIPQEEAVEQLLKLIEQDKQHE